MLTGPALIDAITREESDPPSGIETLGLGRTHRWLTTMEPGHAVFEWPVDDRYLNLEGAVICSWLAALGDQVLFFAGTSLCAEGEVTRMASFSLDILEDVTAGVQLVDGMVERRVCDVMHARCEFRSADGVLHAVMTARIEVHMVT